LGRFSSAYFYRPVAAMRCGILTFLKDGRKFWRIPVSYFTEMYLQDKFKEPEEKKVFLVPNFFLQKLLFSRSKILNREKLWCMKMNWWQQNQYERIFSSSDRENDGY
jgi:hypothetical protein